MAVIKCDVLVIGAGPAGAVSALYCSKHGLNTVLIEMNDDVGAHTTTRIDSSTDFGLTAIISELGLKTENLVYNSNWHSPSGSSFTLNSKIGEYYFKRGPHPDSFECSTVSKAINNGCKLFGGVRVAKITKDSGRINAVAISQGGGTIEIKPELIIAADGEDSIFHRYIDKHFVNKNCVAYGVTGTGFIQPDTSEIYFDANLAPGGYFYIVTCPLGLSSAAIVLDQKKMKRSSESYFYDFLSKTTIRDTIKSIHNQFGGERRLFMLNRHVQQNLLFVGDAAGLIDPLMGYGMMPAIVSGYYAGKYSAEAVKKGDYAALKAYEREVRTRFNRRMSYVFSRIFESLDNKDLDTLIKMANDLDDRTNVDDLLMRLSVSGFIYSSIVFLANLPNSGRLLAKSCQSICRAISMSRC